MDNKSFMDSYINLWYNVYDNIINIAKYEEVYPELMGRNFGEKAMDFL